MTSSLELTATTFRDFVSNEIEEAEGELLCCMLATSVNKPSQIPFYLWLFISAVVVFVLMAYCSLPAQRRRST